MSIYSHSFTSIDFKIFRKCAGHHVTAISKVCVIETIALHVNDWMTSAWNTCIVSKMAIKLMPLNCLASLAYAQEHAGSLDDMQHFLDFLQSPLD